MQTVITVAAFLIIGLALAGFASLAIILRADTKDGRYTNAGILDTTRHD